MPYDCFARARRSIRWNGYDYTRAGAYFVTICTRRRECVLDDPVVAGIIWDVWQALPGWFPTIALDAFVVMPNHVHLVVWLQSAAEGAAGGDDGAGATIAIASEGAGASPAPTGNVDDVGATLAVAQDAVAHDAAVAAHDWTIPSPESANPAPTLGDVIGAFKSLVFTVYLHWVNTRDPARRAKFWQRNYYEHVVRNERELNAIRNYIQQNPVKWDLDRDNPVNRRPEAGTVAEYLRESGVM